MQRHQRSLFELSQKAAHELPYYRDEQGGEHIADANALAKGKVDADAEYQDISDEGKAGQHRVGHNVTGEQADDIKYALIQEHRQG